MKMRKSQSAIEFIVLASFMLLVIISFFAVISSRILEAREEGNRKIAEDIANLAYREIEIATSVNDGYTRVFTMPPTIDGVEYSIKIVDNRELVVNYLDYEHIKFLPPNVNGDISTGLNRIKKIEGIIFINAVPLPPILLMKSSLFNVISFDNKGNAVLKGSIQQNSNPQPTSDDEFVFKNKNGDNVAVINLVTGNMFIKGDFFQNQPTLAPSALSSDFIVKDSSGNVISYIDESGNFYLKGRLTQNGNP